MKHLYLAAWAFLAGIAATSCSSASDAHVADPAIEANPALSSIMTRSSVRAYTEQAISNDTIEALLRAAMAAPTAVNSQPWHFVVVTDRARLDSIAATLPNAERMLNHAPLAIAVCGNESRFLQGDGREYWVQDCSAATENLLLAAHALGLGAVWCGIYPIADRVADARRALLLPDSITPLCIVPIGHPADEPIVKDKWDISKITYLN
ncbi:MAG: nitroreductase family protein [Muribaculaceae bacterium]